VHCFWFVEFKTCRNIMHARRNIIIIIIIYTIMFAIWETSCSVFLRRTETNLARSEEKIKSVLCTLRVPDCMLHLYRLWFIYFMSAKTDIHNIQRCVLTSGDLKWIPIWGDYLRPDRFWRQRIFQTEKTFARWAVYNTCHICVYKETDRERER